MNARDFLPGRGRVETVGGLAGGGGVDLPPGAAFTLADLVAAILSHRLLVLALTFAGALAGFVAAKQVTPHYSAQASLISDPSLAGFSEGASREMTIDPSMTPTIVETVGSPVVIERALGALLPELRARLVAESGIAEETAAAPDPAAAAREEPLLRQFLAKSLKVTNSGRSYVIYVGYISGDAELSAAVANAVAHAYLDYRAELKRGGSSVMLRSLGDEIVTLKSELQAAERTAQSMREQVRLLAARSEALTGRQQEAAIEESSGLYARQREAERAAEALAAVYERLLLAQREIQSRISVPDLDVQLFAPAPTPLTPGGFNVKPVLLALGLLGGFCLGASIALLRARWTGVKRRKKA